MFREEEREGFVARPCHTRGKLECEDNRLGASFAVASRTARYRVGCEAMARSPTMPCGRWQIHSSPPMKVAEKCYASRCIMTSVAAPNLISASKPA